MKRIHDRDKTGWMAANYWGPWAVATGLSLVPQWGLGGLKVILDIATTVVGVWYLIEFGFLDGTQGKNAYGPSPKGARAVRDRGRRLRLGLPVRRGAA